MGDVQTTVLVHPASAMNAKLILDKIILYNHPPMNRAQLQLSKGDTELQTQNANLGRDYQFSNALRKKLFDAYLSSRYTRVPFTRGDVEPVEITVTEAERGALGQLMHLQEKHTWRDFAGYDRVVYMQPEIAAEADLFFNSNPHGRYYSELRDKLLEAYHKGLRDESLEPVPIKVTYSEYKKLRPFLEFEVQRDFDFAAQLADQRRERRERVTARTFTDRFV